MQSLSQVEASASLLGISLSHDLVMPTNTAPVSGPGVRSNNAGERCCLAEWRPANSGQHPTGHFPRQRGWSFPGLSAETRCLVPNLRARAHCEAPLRFDGSELEWLRADSSWQVTYRTRPHPPAVAAASGARAGLVSAAPQTIPAQPGRCASGASSRLACGRHSRPAVHPTESRPARCAHSHRSAAGRTEP